MLLLPSIVVLRRLSQAADIHAANLLAMLQHWGGGVLQAGSDCITPPVLPSLRRLQAPYVLEVVRAPPVVGGEAQRARAVAALRSMLRVSPTLFSGATNAEPVTADYAQLALSRLTAGELAGVAEWEAVARAPALALWLYPGAFGAWLLCIRHWCALHACVYAAMW